MYKCVRLCGYVKRVWRDSLQPFDRQLPFSIMKLFSTQSKRKKKKDLIALHRSLRQKLWNLTVASVRLHCSTRHRTLLQCFFHSICFCSNHTGLLLVFVIILLKSTEVHVTLSSFELPDFGFRDIFFYIPRHVYTWRHKTFVRKAGNYKDRLMKVIQVQNRTKYIQFHEVNITCG